MLLRYLSQVFCPSEGGRGIGMRRPVLLQFVVKLKGDTHE
jgi:hypothetical protein